MSVLAATPTELDGNIHYPALSDMHRPLNEAAADKNRK
jgi:hypothetical protein